MRIQTEGLRLNDCIDEMIGEIILSYRNWNEFGASLGRHFSRLRFFVVLARVKGKGKRS